MIAVIDNVKSVSFVLSQVAPVYQHARKAVMLLRITMLDKSEVLT